LKGSSKIWRGQAFKLVLDRPRIMGILNVTPDSFYDGGRYSDIDRAIARAEALISDGADIVDVGGESTRPNSDPVPSDEQVKRTAPVVREIKKRWPDTIVSIDTTNSQVARAALDEGAAIINDISGFLFDPDMPKLAGDYGCGCVAMHIKGTPKNMQEDPQYDDLWGEIKGYIASGVKLLEDAGVSDESIAVDPGIGFGKKLEHNLRILRELGELGELGFPITIGPSRKSFIGMILDLPTEERLEGSIAACVVGVLNGASVVRVHDVREVKRALDVAWAIANG